MRSAFIASALAFGAIALCSPASAAIMVIGEGPAHSCYQAALDDRGDASALRDCDVALDDMALTTRDTVATLINRGIIHMNREESSAALADFDRALRLNPEAGEAYINQGAALILLGRSHEALASLNRGIELNASELHKAYFNRALAYEELGNARAAYEDYTRAAQLAPDWEMPRQELARFTVTRRGS